MTDYFVKTATAVAAPSDASDGLDAFGFALASASYDDTGNVGGEKHLSLTGAFSAYTFTAGDEIYLSAGTGLTVGLYTIASRVDDDAVLLTTSPVAGDASDVASATGPFATIGKALSLAATNDAVRICDDGSHRPTVELAVVGQDLTLQGATAQGLALSGANYAIVEMSSLPALASLFVPTRSHKLRNLLVRSRSEGGLPWRLTRLITVDIVDCKIDMR